MPTESPLVLYISFHTALPEDSAVAGNYARVSDTGWDPEEPIVVDTAPNPKPREIKTIWQHLKEG